ncbi:MAG TPA: serine/threonine-protein kinase [Planctomycetota bacterium]
MTDERRIQELAEEALSSQRTPEEVCRDAPGLLADVRAHLARVAEVDAELDALLPGSGPEGSVEASAEPALPVIPGYELKGLLGRGGMGVVYRARHLGLERDVALKMLLAGDLAGPRELERFLLEARAIANLSHPNIVQVHDVSAREGRPFFTMELVEGGTLSQRLAGTPQPADSAAELVACLADAVEYAHRIGIVHRDLKPANVLLTPAGVPKVSDFGLARRVTGGEELTVTGTILGTPSYMAPEQIRGGPVGSGADVYALGAILYEGLTGRPPFRSESPVATQLQVLSREPVRPALLNARVPRDLETICLCCLHKEPARRYASAAELAADLRRFLAREPIHARPVGWLERAYLWGRRRPALATAILLAAVLLGFLGARVARDQALARERREQAALWSPRIDDLFAELGGGNLVQARSLLDQVPEVLDAELRERVARARRELRLVEELDGIRLQRVAITEGRFDRSENRRRADQAYAEAFRNAGFGSVTDAPEAVAARVRAAAVRLALVGALDDWALCAGDGARAAWLLDVARGADPAPSPWRERLRDPALRLDEATLAELADDLRAKRMTVQLVVGAAERLREADVDVIPLLTVVQRAHPGDFWANFALGDVLWADTPAEAIRYAQAAVAIRPRSSLAHQALGTALRRAGRIEDAFEAYSQAVQVEPDFAEAHGRLALLLYQAGKYDEAIAAGREAVRLDPGLAWARFNLGTTLTLQGRAAEALEEHRASLRLDPDSVLGNQGLGECLGHLGRWREALASFQRTVELEPLPVHHHNLGACLERLGELTEAENEYRRALALDPVHRSSLKALRLLLVPTGREEEALALFHAESQAGPDDPEAWNGYAELCAYAGRWEEYERVCVELLERFGTVGEPRTCERIGRACLLQPSGERRDSATALIERALAAPESVPSLRPYFEMALALAELRGGRFESALALLRGKAGAVLAPTPELIRALALHHTGATAEARRSLALAALGFDWSPDAARDHDAWIRHVLRREAEELVLPELPELLAGRGEPRDDVTRAALIASCLSTSRYTAASRLYAILLGEPSALADRELRLRVARATARAGAGLGLDPAADTERALFRARVRAVLRLDLAACGERMAQGLAGHAGASALLEPWRKDAAFTWLRETSGALPPAERDEDRALWREVEALARRLDVVE